MTLVERSKISTGTGKQIGVLRAVPRKRALLNDARKLELPDAFSEIIDNVIDNFAKQARLGLPTRKLQLRFTVTDDAISVDENSGGVSPDDLLAFVQVGGQGDVPADVPRIGIWGVGQKQALAALGSDITISTRYWNPRQNYDVSAKAGDQVVLRMDEAWWRDDEDWNVPVFAPTTDLPAGVTQYSIRRLNRRIDDVALEELKKELALVYGDTLVASDTLITINGAELPAKPSLTEAALRQTFAFPPGFEPSHHYFDLLVSQPSVLGIGSVDVPRRVRLEVLVGLTPRQEQQTSGVYMFGVPTAATGSKLGPRMFVKQPLQDESVGYSSGPRSILRKHSSLGRLRIYCIFYGNSEDIPWGLPGSPVKRGYNAANPFASQIRDRIRDAAAPYARFTTRAREIDIVPYSYLWTEMPDEEKKSILRRGAQLAMPEDVDEPDVAPKVRALLRSKPRFTFHTWDHTKDRERPSELAPALDEKLASEAAGIVVRRDQRLREIAGGDPVQAVDVLLSALNEVEQRDAGGWTADSSEASDERTVPVTIRLSREVLRQLTQKAGTTNRSEAIARAIHVYLDSK